jgi:hypothetical protein
LKQHPHGIIIVSKAWFGILALRACKAAALSSTIRGIANKLGGVTQKEILDWMTTGDPVNGSVWGQYEQLMLQQNLKEELYDEYG